MSVLEALILGIIQGLTEFLPVSSSGHLEIAKMLFGDTLVGSESLFMTVMLHGATALSTLVIFRKEIVEILAGLVQFKWNEHTVFSLKIILSMLPAVVVGVVFSEEIESLFGGQIVLVGGLLMVTALLLFLADRAKTTEKGVSFWGALIIGVAQAIAILPGISRSGATISTSVLLGVDRTRATRFSFLMVVPLIFGKMAKDLLSSDFSVQGESVLPIVIGFIGAFITGLFACTWMIQIVRKSKLVYFSVYCAVIGLIAVIGGVFF